MKRDDTQMAGGGDTDPRIGEVVDGRYRILGALGRGGMGIVYRAEHVSIRRPVALKLIHPELGAAPDFVKRFEREAVAMGRLDHPNCVAVSDFGKLEDGALYLVMELLAGEPLSAALTRERRFPVVRALGIVRHILRGLRHAHRAGVVHRDLKPENVFLVAREDEPDFAKILDFGIAKLVGPNELDSGDKLTQTGFAVGTPKYIAPELAFGDKVTPQADIYSTAVIAFEMVTGAPPFVADDPISVLTMHAGKPVPAFAEVAPDLAVPPAVEELIRHGLGKRREERIADADAFLARVEDLLRSLGDPLGGPGRPSHDVLAAPAPPMTAPLPAQAFAPPPAAAPPPPTLPRPDSLPPPPARTPLPGYAPTVAPLPVPGAAPPPGVAPPQAVQPTEIVRAPARVSWKGPAKLLAIIVAASLFVGLAAGNCQSADERLREYVHLLRNGETCEERREAVRKLRALGDPRAIEPLQNARRRMRGGVLGVGDRNENACLRREAEEAIRHLRGR
jgi:serine/threonine protein kinase